MSVYHVVAPEPQRVMDKLGFKYEYRVLLERRTGDPDNYPTLVLEEGWAGERSTALRKQTQAVNMLRRFREASEDEVVFHPREET